LKSTRTQSSIRIALATRGFDTGPLPLPIAAGRAGQMSEFQRWFAAWLKE
jgi:hypothetical protein